MVHRARIYPLTLARNDPDPILTLTKSWNPSPSSARPTPVSVRFLFVMVGSTIANVRISQLRHTLRVSYERFSERLVLRHRRLPLRCQIHVTLWNDGTVFLIGKAMSTQDNKGWHVHWPKRLANNTIDCRDAEQGARYFLIIRGHRYSHLRSVHGVTRICSRRSGYSPPIWIIWRSRMRRLLPYEINEDGPRGRFNTVHGLQYRPEGAAHSSSTEVSCLTLRPINSGSPVGGCCSV